MRRRETKGDANGRLRRSLPFKTDGSKQEERGERKETDAPQHPLPYLAEVSPLLGEGFAIARSRKRTVEPDPSGRGGGGGGMSLEREEGLRDEERDGWM